MKQLRNVLIAAALTVGLLVAGGSVALAAPAAGVAPGQDPSPDPGPGTAQAAPADAGTTPDGGSGSGSGSGQSDGTPQIGSVSQVAANLAAQRSADALARTTAVSRYASPAAKSEAIWESRGRPDRLIIIRRGSIDSVENGRLERHAVRPVSTITLGTVADYVPSSWLSVDGATARLSATLVLTTGITLRVGTTVSQLLLTGGATPQAAASLFVGAGALSLRGVKVTSADPVSGAPMPDTPGRPYISVAANGRLDVADAAVDALGATVGTKTFAAIVFGEGSHGSVVGTTLTANTIGLMLEGSVGVVVENVSASQSASNGIVLSGDTGTSLLGIMVEGNNANGVFVTGKSTTRVISGITTRGNHDFGVSVTSQTGTQVSGIVALGDGAGGVEINHSTNATVSDLTTTDEPVALYSHVSSNHLTLAHLNVTGGRRGIVIEKTTIGVTLVASTVNGADLGISLGGHQMSLTDVNVVGSQTAATVERGASNVSVDGLTISGGNFGFIANPGTSGVVLRNLVAEDVSTTALRALSPGEQVVGGRIDGSTTGIDVQAATTLSGLAIVGAGTGVRARSTTAIHAMQVDVTAVSVGINVADGTPFVLTDSRVHALESIRGTTVEQGVNDLSLPALSVLGAIGVPLILLAILLEGVALLRQRRSARRSQGIAELTAPPVRTDHVGAGR